MNFRAAILRLSQIDIFILLHFLSHILFFLAFMVLQTSFLFWYIFIRFLLILSLDSFQMWYPFSFTNCQFHWFIIACCFLFSIDFPWTSTHDFYKYLLMYFRKCLQSSPTPSLISHTSFSIRHILYAYFICSALDSLLCIFIFLTFSILYPPFLHHSGRCIGIARRF